ncbi:MAG: carbonic anhydrase [Brevinematia bacterium]
MTCSDSRVIAELITNSLPGELFVVKNIANIVPPYENSDISSSVAGAIEYAVLVLNVQNIVVCGHSNCGGCNALYLEEEKLKDKPNVKKWISISKEIPEKVKQLINEKDLEKRSEITEKLNVVKQLENLLTYPFVKEKVKNGEVKIYGWYFVIKTGDLYNYNFKTGEFEIVKEE